MKRPSFQYYPKDWRADRVFGCSIAARGLWHEMIGLMHESPRYGYLCDKKGEPIPSDQVARMCGVEISEYELLVKELLNAGVPRVTSGLILYSKRMVDDEKKRKEWRNRQQNHRDRTRDVTHDVTPMSRHSSSSSSSAIQEEKHKTYVRQKQPDVPEDFGIFWNLYPRHDAKVKCLSKWRNLNASDRAAAIAKIAEFKQSGRWNDPQFIMQPLTYLNGRRWEDEISPQNGVNGNGANLSAHQERQRRTLEAARRTLERHGDAGISEMRPALPHGTN